jgi:hypothetical protein
MKCPLESKHGSDRIMEYCTGALSSEDRSALDWHVSECARCRQLVEAQRSVWNMLDAWEPAPVSEDFNRRLYARIDAEESGRGWISGWVRAWTARMSPLSWKPAIPVAAAFMTLVAVIMLQSPAVRQDSVDESKVRVEKVDIHQVERTLEDLDMLKQLNPVSSSTDSGSSRPM